MTLSDSSPWTFDGESAPLSTSGPAVTLIDGRTFCISEVSGNISDLGPQGLFVLDTRYVSRLCFLIDGDPIETLGVDQKNSFSASFVGRHIGAVKVADTPTVAIRNRQLNRGLTEQLQVRNYGDEPAMLLVSLIIDADFANLFAVKERRVPDDLEVVRSHDENGVWFEPKERQSIGLRVDADVGPNATESGRLDWTAEIEPGGTWTVGVQFTPWLAGKPIAGPAESRGADPNRRLVEWIEKMPEIESDNSALNSCTSKTLADLASLRIFDPKQPDKPVVAAGAPWFMTLFGRDSLLASWMALLVDPDLASGVVQTLARFQGTEINSATDEQPGKIMHEIRFSDANSAALDEGELYYGTADATPLFVMLLGELKRWGAADSVVDSLLPNADRALEWMTEYGDSDGDGYIEYKRSEEHGLANQGWKDSWDGVRYADGSVANAPIALCEVQAYAYAAYRARARLAEDGGDYETAIRWERKASELRTQFNEDFWLEDKGWFAVGLDADKNPIDSLTSNIGHCLWAGIVDDEKAAIAAEKLMSTDMFSGWGTRTLAANTPGYNPTGYHVGSVWPHDTAIVAAGLMRYDFVEPAHRLMMALLEAGEKSGGRLPELMAGFSRDEFATPMAYPASCSPQAWSAAAPLLLLRWMLRLDPWFSKGRLWADPILPPGITRLKVSEIPIGDARISITVEDNEIAVEGLPEGVELKRGLRPGRPRDRWT